MASNLVNDFETLRTPSRRRRIIAVISGVTLVAALAWMHFKGTRSIILVDGKPVVCVCSPKEAEDVLERIKRGAGCDPSEVEFRQNVVVARAPSHARPVSRHRALNIVRTIVSPVFCRWSIIVDGVPKVAVPSREVAGEVLDLAKLKFGCLAKNLAEEPQFKEHVKVDMAAVSPSIYRKTPQAALDLLFEERPTEFECGTYVVKKGDVACAIASRYNLSLQELKALNPGAQLDELQIGDEIRVKAAKQAKPKLTVIVRDLRVGVEPMPPPVRRISSAKLYTGKTLVISQGTWGMRKVKVADIYENGAKVGSEILDEEVIKEPSARIVAVGIKPRPRW